MIAEAEACFWQALASVRCQQAKSLELLAGMNLNWLWQAQGRRAEAQRLLAESYLWLTAGFDTAGLREAQVLLAELA